LLLLLLGCADGYRSRGEARHSSNRGWGPKPQGIPLGRGWRHYVGTIPRSQQLLRTKPCLPRGRKTPHCIHKGVIAGEQCRGNDRHGKGSRLLLLLLLLL
jgi:hypothetical protein